MLPVLFAQLVTPPLQNSPVRLPGPDANQQRPGRAPAAPLLAPDGALPAPPAPGPTDAVPPATTPDSTSGAAPAVRNLSVYSAEEVRRILARCSSEPDRQQRLQACAAALTARLVSDGYINSRVYVNADPAPGWLEVVEGRIVEVQVSSRDARLAQRTRRLLQPLQGSILRLSRVQDALERLRQQAGVSDVRAKLSRLGSDPAQGVLNLSLQPSGQPWQGDLSLRNDGSNGSGEARALATLLKGNLATAGDTLLLYGEVNSDNTPSLGAVISSISYSLPIADQWTITGSFGYSRRNLIETTNNSLGTVSSNQFQGLGQLEWVFSESLHQRWSVVLGYSGNRSNVYLDGQALSSSQAPAAVRSPQNGYLRLGLNASGSQAKLAWGANLLLLQGIAAATPEQQRQELARAGINPGQANAVSGLVSAAWGFAPSWQLAVRAGGQWAFNPLSSPMQFTIGSDAGIRGLPGQLISGDNGWLGTAELSWTFWQNKHHAFQMVPFIGVGGVSTSRRSTTVSDTVGSGGLLGRWVGGSHWMVELGWVEQFQTNDNLGTWTDWALGQGLYAQVKYRF